MSKTIRTATLVALLLGFITLGSGCSMMGQHSMRNIPAAEDKSAGQFQVIKLSPLGTKDVYTGSITENLTVQSALEQAGAIKSFSNAKVDLFRIIPNSPQPLKMACDFQPGKKIIKYEQDYQILPGDRLVVTSEKNAVEKIMGR
jgi:hypothetical protein